MAGLTKPSSRQIRHAGDTVENKLIELDGSATTAELNALAASVYTKEETYSKAEVDAIAADEALINAIIFG